MSLKRFQRALLTWMWGFVGGVAGGGASALAAKFGLDGLHSLGITEVPTFSFKQMGYIFLSGVISHGVMYVMKTPLPALDFDDTTTFTKQPTVTKDPNENKNP